ncbi:UNKNOWN [Stylonychia lemnae]|uniref:Uncharacterized protein n=1 Tax=Stylonychia lemnae TaxID=5949 RepID=A0A078B3N2_STYLE|nr:UNKNOWN [Stylonychia lemnae]|eukprot:CDW88856.1 UNKNOWN [Stylonychia lemnae]
MQRNKNFSYKLEEFIRSLDQYGHPIVFTYNKSSSFKTFFGGIVTLCREVFISQDEFDIGFVIDLFYLPKDHSIKNIDEYIEVNIQQIKTSQIKGEYFYEVIPLHFSKCQAGRFKGELTQSEIFDISNRYFCPIDFKTAFYGSYSTQKASMLQVQVRKCNQENLRIKNKTLTCASQAEMDIVFNKLALTILMTNQFIDVNEKSGNPIKTVLKQFYATSKAGLSLQYQLRFGENFLIQSTSSISSMLGQQNLTYYTITDDQMNISIINHSQNNNFNLQLTYQQNRTRIVKQCLFKRKNQRILTQNVLFKQAKQKLDEKFEIIKILKNQNMLKFIKQVTLAKYQRRLIPYFKQNLIRIKDQNIQVMKNSEQKLISWKELTKEQKIITRFYLAQVIQNTGQNAIDKRILKNLDQNFINVQNRVAITKLNKNAILQRLKEKQKYQDKFDEEQKYDVVRQKINLKEGSQENLQSIFQSDITNQTLQEDSLFVDQFLEQELEI